MSDRKNRSKCLLAIWVQFLHFTYKNDSFFTDWNFSFLNLPMFEILFSFSGIKTAISVNYQNIKRMPAEFSRVISWNIQRVAVHTISMNRTGCEPLQLVEIRIRFDFRICISYLIPWMDRISKHEETKHRNTNKQKHRRSSSHVRSFPNVHHRHIIGYRCLRGIIFLMLYFHVFSTN